MIDFSRIHDFIDYELKIHPKCRLIDLLKLIFQVLEGPSHLIKNKDRANDYLMNELMDKKRYLLERPNDFAENSIYYKNNLIFIEDGQHADCLFIPLDLENNLARVSLNLIYDGVIAYDEFFESFYKTAQNYPQHNLSIHSIFEILISFLSENSIKYDNMEIVQLRDIIQKERLFSHSKEYHNFYLPSYRLINIDYIENFKNRVRHFYEK